MSAFTGLIPLLLIFGIFYLLIILPEQKRRRKLQELINSLKVGDKVVTSGGIYGTVLNLRDDRLIIRSDQTRLEIARSAVAGLQVEPGQEQASVQ
jgi:preprotein translocase subunit YajC